MRAKLSQLKIRDLALFVMVASVAALVVVIVGREAGLGQQAGAGIEPIGDASGSATQQQESEGDATTEPLSVTLSGPEICETEPGLGGSSSRLDGSRRYDVYLGIMNVAEVPVRWQIAGGTPPYKLEIDGETRDAQHEYIGTSGTASVSCALRLGEVTYNESPARDFRRYKDDVLVDSGSKTIRATVTDATGRTNTAEINMYVILAFGGTGRDLTEGQTYRIWGQLITIPVGVSARLGGVEVSDCDGDDQCEATIDIYARGSGFRIGAAIGVETGAVFGKGISLDRDGAAGAADLRRQAEGHLAALNRLHR